MGTIPRLFRVNLWLAAALVVSPVVPSFAAIPQTPVSQIAASSAQQVPPPERKTLAREEVPAEMKANILMARGEYAAAITAYQQTDLKSAVVMNSIGMAYHHLYALDEARKAYEAALVINPRFAPASNNLAAVFYGQRNFGEAEHYYKRALKHTSESAVIYANLGTAYFAQAKYKQGIKAYRKAFSIDQQVFAPREAALVEAGASREQRIAMNYFVAATYARVGQHDQALIFLRKAFDEGFRDRKRLMEDKEFATLRATPQFQELLVQENVN
jgi:tetratricopeptide (TPR) repeat protein